MIALLIFLLRLLVLPSKPKRGLEAENVALRRQLAILQRKVRSRVRLTNSDRLFFVLLYRWFPLILKTMTIIQPGTLVRWHRAGFRRVLLSPAACAPWAFATSLSRPARHGRTALRNG